MILMLVMIITIICYSNQRLLGSNCEFANGCCLFLGYVGSRAQDYVNYVRIPIRVSQIKQAKCRI